MKMLTKMIVDNFEKNILKMCGQEDAIDDKFNKHTQELLNGSLESF
jgi:hypothetical protein